MSSAVVSSARSGATGLIRRNRMRGSMICVSKMVKWLSPTPAQVAIELCVFVFVSANNLCATVSLCKAYDLSVERTTADAGMSQVELTVYLRNKAQVACVVKGAPHIKLIDGRGNPLILKHRSLRKMAHLRSAVILQPRESAYFQLSFGTSNAYEASECPPAASTVVIRLPRDRGSLEISLNLQACTKLSVSEFRKASATR
jgi:hypothetical protein